MGNSITVVWTDPSATAEVTISDASGASGDFTVAGEAVTFPYTITATTMFATAKNGTYTVSVKQGGVEILGEDDTAKVYRLEGSGVVVKPTPDNNANAALSATYERVASWNVLAPRNGMAGAAGDGTTDDTDAIQAIIDAAVASGEPVDIYFPAADYKVSPQAGDRACLRVPTSQVRLRGVKNLSRIFVDPTLTLTPGQLVHVIDLGTATAGVSDVLIENLRIDGNHSTLATGYVQGISARQDTDPLAYCANVTVRGCYIYDTNVAIGSVKNTGTAASDANRLAAQHRNWRIEGNTVIKTANKAIELQETMDSWITGNYVNDAEDGPQAINFSRHIIISDNRVYYNGTGINVTEGCTYIDVLNNHVECQSTTKGYGGIVVRREPYANATDISHVLIQGNTVVDSVSPSKRGFLFQLRTQNTGSSTFTNVRIVDNTFQAKVLLHDPDFPTKSASVDLYVAGNRFGSTCETHASWASGTTRIIGNILTNAHTCASDGWTYRSNTFKNGLTVTADASAVKVLGNDMSAFTDSGVGTVKAANVVAGELVA